MVLNLHSHHFSFSLLSDIRTWFKNGDCVLYHVEFLKLGESAQVNFIGLGLSLLDVTRSSPDPIRDESENHHAQATNDSA